MKQRFEQTVQRTFNGHNDTFSFQVGSVDGKKLNAKLGISGGRLRLGGCALTPTASVKNLNSF